MEQESLLAILKGGGELTNQSLLDFFNAQADSWRASTDESGPSSVLAKQLTPYLLRSLNSNTTSTCQTNVDTRRLSLCVGCLAFVIEHSAEPEKVLGLDSNTGQMIRLCLSRGVYPDGSFISPSVCPTPLQEVGVCRRALCKFLMIRQVANSSTVQAEINGFVRKWWQRLHAVTTDDSTEFKKKTVNFEMPTSSSTHQGDVPPLRAALEIIVSVVETRCAWLVANLLSLNRDLDASFLLAYLRSSDAPTSVASANLLSSLLILQLVPSKTTMAEWLPSVAELTTSKLEEQLDRTEESSQWPNDERFDTLLAYMRLFFWASTGQSEDTSSAALGLRLLKISIASLKCSRLSAPLLLYSMRSCLSRLEEYLTSVIDVDTLEQLRQLLTSEISFGHQERIAADEICALLSTLIDRKSRQMFESPPPTPSFDMLPNEGHANDASPVMTQREAWLFHPHSASTPHQQLKSPRVSDDSTVSMNLSLMRLDDDEPTRTRTEGSGQVVDVAAPTRAATDAIETLQSQIGCGGRVTVLQADNTLLRQQVLELQRELSSSRLQVDREKETRDEQSVLLQEAWAKMSLLARAESEAQHERQEAQAWAKEMQERLLACQEEASGHSTNVAEANWQVKEMQVQVEAGAVAEAKLKERVRVLEAERISAAALAQLELDSLRQHGEQIAREQYQALQQCERALQAEREKTIIAEESLKSTLEFLRNEREKVASMSNELSTHRNLIRVINQMSAAASNTGGVVTGPADDKLNLNQLRHLSQALEDDDQENARENFR